MNNIKLQQKNSSFSKLRGLDLQEVLVRVDNMNMVYRDSLSFPNKLTFGVEIEYEEVSKREVDNFIDKNRTLRDWISKNDHSLVRGGEINSPILTDNVRNWKNLEEICAFLKKNNALTTRNAGGHIHFGADFLGENSKAWINLLKIWAVYEHIIYRTTYGETLIPRTEMMRFALPIADRIYRNLEEYDSKKHISELLSMFSYFSGSLGLDFSHIHGYIQKPAYKNTIEFRTPNGTVDEVIWQNNINLFGKLLMSSKSNNFDNEYMEYKYEKRQDEIINEKFYQQIYLKDALEFADIAFNNDLDKCYFLKQYLKDFEVATPLQHKIMAKKFTRN